jgi:hypothetical protein
MQSLQGVGICPLKGHFFIGVGSMVLVQVKSSLLKIYSCLKGRWPSTVVAKKKMCSHSNAPCAWIALLYCYSGYLPFRRSFLKFRNFKWSCAVCLDTKFLQFHAPSLQFRGLNCFTPLHNSVVPVDAYQFEVLYALAVVQAVIMYWLCRITGRLSLQHDLVYIFDVIYFDK